MIAVVLGLLISLVCFCAACFFVYVGRYDATPALVLALSISVIGFAGGLVLASIGAIVGAIT